MSQPQFLTDLAADAQSLGRVRHVDSQLVLESMVLLLGHFTGNMVCNHRGEPVNVAHNVMLLSTRRSCPLWLKPIIAHLHSRRTEANSFLDNLMSTGLMQQQPENDDYDVVKQMLRRAHPTPFAMHDMFDNGFSLLSPPIGRYMIARGDGPLSQGQAVDDSVLLVEGSQHIKELCAQDQSNSLYTRIQGHATPRISVYGWCEGNTGILDTELPGMPLLLPAQYGNGMRMNTGIEGRSIVHTRNVFYDPGRDIRVFTSLLSRLLNMRAAEQVMRFEPNDKCRELLLREADAEHRDVQEFPEAHRRLAMPVMGLGLSLAALFWLLAYRPRMPMETVALTSAAIDIAQGIRRRSLTWLRRELAASCPQINSMDTIVLDKMRQAGCMLRPRQIQRMFHRMHSQELHEVLDRLLAQGRVQRNGGKVVAV